jgi:hypothetical protein
VLAATGRPYFNADPVFLALAAGHLHTPLQAEVQRLLLVCLYVKLFCVLGCLLSFDHLLKHLLPPRVYLQVSSSRAGPVCEGTTQGESTQDCAAILTADAGTAGASSSAAGAAADHPPAGSVSGRGVGGAGGSKSAGVSAQILATGATPGPGSSLQPQLQAQAFGSSGVLSSVDSDRETVIFGEEEPHDDRSKRLCVRCGLVVCVCEQGWLSVPMCV